MTPRNPYEVSGRLLKVNALLEKLWEYKFTVEQVCLMTADDWIAVAKQAGCNPPHSQETVDMIVEAMMRREDGTKNISPSGPTGPSGTGTTFEERLNAVADKLRAEDEANGTTDV